MVVQSWHVAASGRALITEIKLKLTAKVDKSGPFKTILVKGRHKLRSDKCD